VLNLLECLTDLLLLEELRQLIRRAVKITKSTLLLLLAHSLFKVGHRRLSIWLSLAEVVDQSSTPEVAVLVDIDHL
jgi:hypothetical protein